MPTPSPSEEVPDSHRSQLTVPLPPTSSATMPPPPRSEEVPDSHDTQQPLTTPPPHEDSEEHDHPKPPPTPQPLPHFPTATARTSPFILKLRAAPLRLLLPLPRAPPPLTDIHAPPTGPYFFYGTLMSPALLAEILSLDTPPLPRLRPACIIGYQCKLWGQYPALQDGPTGATVVGAAYDVATTAHAARLAEYETRAYVVRSCVVRYSDGAEPERALGSVFVFGGVRGS